MPISYGYVETIQEWPCHLNVLYVRPENDVVANYPIPRNETIQQNFIRAAEGGPIEVFSNEEGAVFSVRIKDQIVLNRPDIPMIQPSDWTYIR